MYPVQPGEPLAVETYHRLNDIMQEANHRRLVHQAVPPRPGLFSHFHPKRWLVSLFTRVKPAAVADQAKSVPLSSQPPC